MKKQLILAVSAIALVLALFLFGNTVAKKKPTPTTATQKTATSFNINNFIAEYKKKLTPSQLVFLNKLENSVTRGNVSTQQIQVNNSIANFWKDSINAFEPYAFYIAQASKLDNSEKNLTFAAQLFLANLKGEQDEAKLNWETEEAIALFEQALKVNPTNDDLKIGLGSCYIFGKGKFGGAAETMQGIQKLLEVVRKDSTNMKAQLVLGIGGCVSGQFDKAIERLQKVVKAEPTNLEAIYFLAGANADKGNKAEALKWYQLSKRLANDAHLTEEIEQKIKQLH